MEWIQAPATGRGMEWSGMEQQFWYGIWKMQGMEWKIIFYTFILIPCLVKNAVIHLKNAFIN